MGCENPRAMHLVNNQTICVDNIIIIWRIFTNQGLHFCLHCQLNKFPACSVECDDSTEGCLEVKWHSCLFFTKLCLPVGWITSSTHPIHDFPLFLVWSLLYHLCPHAVGAFYWHKCGARPMHIKFALYDAQLDSQEWISYPSLWYILNIQGWCALTHFGSFLVFQSAFCYALLLLTHTIPQRGPGPDITKQKDLLTVSSSHYFHSNQPLLAFTIVWLT